MLRRIALWAVICCTLPGVLPVTAAAQNGQVVSSSRKNASEVRHCFAVLGAINSPGVVSTRDRHLTLEALIKKAGGLTSRTAIRVRIIRHGRMVLNARLDASLAVRLEPGEVVVVAGDGRGATQPAPQTASRFRDGAPVDVAVVGLIERPVVLRLRPRHASLSSLIALLGQHPNVARFVQLVGGGRMDRLRTGDVLVVDRRVVEPKRIPPLPQPVDLDALPSQTPVRTASATQSRPKDSVRQVQADNRDTPRVPEPGSRNLSTAPPPELRRTGAGPAPAAAPPVPTRPTRTAANIAGSEKPENRAEPPLPPAEHPAADPDLIRKADRQERDGVDSGVSVDWATLIIGVFAVLGVLSAVGLLISMARSAIRGSSRTQPAPSRRTRLDQLLKNELEMRVEPTPIPPGLSFFGRAAGAARIRVDDTHSAGAASRPHVDIRPQTTDQSATRGSVRRTDSGESTGPKSVRGDRSFAQAAASASIAPASIAPQEELG